MSARLRDGLSWCICSDRVVFLDLHADRYFFLPAACDQLFRKWVHDKDQGSGAELTRRLEGLQITVRTSDNEIDLSPASITRATIDLAVDANGNASTLDVIRALLAQRAAAARLRRLPIAQFVRAAKASRSARPANNDRFPLILHRLADAMSVTASIMRKSDQCLARAFAASALSRRHGVALKIVFGVRLDPFSAHCWAQFENSVIVGDLEQTRLFTPILIVQ